MLYCLFVIVNLLSAAYLICYVYYDMSSHHVCMFLLAFYTFLTAQLFVVLAGHSKSLPYVLNVFMSEAVKARLGFACC